MDRGTRQCRSRVVVRARGETDDTSFPDTARRHACERQVSTPPEGWSQSNRAAIEKAMTALRAPVAEAERAYAAAAARQAEVSKALAEQTAVLAHERLAKPRCGANWTR